ncbi:hypothetical protein WJX81_001127 [Elliptochloris bilobata]|uniref:PDZ domain-containing protein n=1 Tax=Elliptochloris bilobata TaxID=381761 RepID=A0AAW1SL78_9CHLO
MYTSGLPPLLDADGPLGAQNRRQLTALAAQPFVQAASTDVQHKSGEELKQQLLTAIKADEGLIRTGRLTAEVKEAVEQIEAAAEAAPLHLGPGEVDGQFELLLNTTNYLDDDACTTLGTLTFQQFGPSDLRLRVYYSEVLTGVQSPTQYCTRSYFKVTDCEHEGLEGVQSALGEYELDTANPARQNVFFTGIRMEPSSSDPAALKAWVDLLSESNASMDPSTGVAEVKFPKKIKGTRANTFCGICSVLRGAQDSRKLAVQVAAALAPPHAWRIPPRCRAFSSTTGLSARPYVGASAQLRSSSDSTAGLAVALAVAAPPAAYARQVAAVEAAPATLEMKAPRPSPAELSPEELQTVALFQENTPSVVNIANIASRQSFYSMDVQQVPQGMGSGFIWDDKGHIVTNFHVIRGASNIKVALIDSSVFPARVIGGDPDKDVAVLELQAPPEKLAELKPVAVGSSANLMVGQRVYAIGNPFGLDHTLTQGIVSGLGRELATPGVRGVPIKNVIQTDAAINPGNSGGVLLDSKGRLIGINTAIASPSGASSGVGFAIPIDQARGLVEQILTYGKVVRPVLGITIAPPQLARQVGEEGVLVLEVPAGTPADKAGFKGTYRDEAGRVILGDIIVGIDGRPVRLQRDLFEALDEKRPGDKIEVEVTRDGRRTQLAVTLGGRDITGME